MRSSIISASPLLALSSLISLVLAEPNVVHLAIAKSYPGPALARRSTVSEDLYNNVTGGSYMANVTVGTPPQKLSLVIDTGSSDVFVLAATADQCTDPQLQQTYGSCVGGTFTATSSSSFVDISPGGFSIQYQDNTGSSGDYFTDTFGIGGITINKFQMGLALNLTTGIGIMGIGYDAGESVTTSNIYPGLVDSLVSAGKINVKAYSLYLDDLESSTGSILFGGIDTKKFVGTLKLLDVQPDSKTQTIDSFFVTLTSVSITNDHGTTTAATTSTFSLPVVLDSGTTITYVPQSVFDIVSTQLGAVSDSSTGIVFVDCNYRTNGSTTHLTFGFGANGPTINVPVSEVIRSLSGRYTGLPFANACSLGIRSAASGPYLLGDTFLRSAYVVYDLDHNQIGLAQTNFGASDSNIVELKASATAIPTLTGVANGQTTVPTSGTFGSGGDSSSSSLTASSTTSSAGTNDTPGSAASASTTKKSGAAATIPAWDASGMLVLGAAALFAAVGAVGFVA